MNVFLHKHIKVYNSYSNKMEKVLKKTIYNWAQSAPVQHEKETAPEILRTTRQSISWTCSVVCLDFASTERRLIRTYLVNCRPPTRSHVDASAHVFINIIDILLLSLLQYLSQTGELLGVPFLTSTLAANKII